MTKKEAIECIENMNLSTNNTQAIIDIIFNVSFESYMQGYDDGYDDCQIKFFKL